MASVELLLPQEALVEGDRALADIIGLSHDNLADLTRTQVHDLGNVTILGTNDKASVMRFHTGPEDTIKRGGTKFKFHAKKELQHSDGVDHSRSMFFKIGVIGETGLSSEQYAAAQTSARPEDATTSNFKAVRNGYSGGKTIAAIDHHRYSPEQNIDALQQVARLMHDAGLTNPEIDGTAGDEGTNPYIDYYVDALREAGHPHPESAITGKSDMLTRPSATGRGAAISHRARMSLTGESSVRAVVQGAGAAGAHYAAEAYDPLDPTDRQQEITIPAIGDLQFHKDGSKTPLTLHTEHSDGLPITRKMIDALNDPNNLDMNHEKVRGNKILAMARMLERMGRNVQVSPKDVLTYDRGAEYLVPAATSNVFTSGNIGNISIKNWLEIGNHTVHDDARSYLKPLGITLIPGEVVNAGGVKVSIEENRRDLSRIHSQETGLYLPEATDDEYNMRLRATMTTATRRVHAVSEKFGVDLQTGANIIGLASYAISRGMEIDTSVRDLLRA